MNYIEYMSGGGVSGDTLRTYILPPTESPRGYFFHPFGSFNFKINDGSQSKTNDVKGGTVASSNTQSNNSGRNNQADNKPTNYAFAGTVGSAILNKPGTYSNK